MTYETAKTLKDEGFPNVEILHGTQGGAIVEHPTLSELIEACGKTFHMLDRYGKDTWRAQGGMCEETGTTPEEAVANLWLALNKK